MSRKEPNVCSSDRIGGTGSLLVIGCLGLVTPDS